jgi:hypothetical protein
MKEHQPKCLLHCECVIYTNCPTCEVDILEILPLGGEVVGEIWKYGYSGTIWNKIKKIK